MLNIYNRLPINVVKGDGVHIFDDNGKRYLDFTSGIATVSFGHCNQYIKEKLSRQLSELWHCSNIFNIPLQERVANRLVDLTFADKVFFCSSGLEAIEAAVKFIRRYFYTQGSKKYRIITLKNGFHGRSMVGISAGGGVKAKEGYYPLLDGFDEVITDDIDQLKNKITENTAAILLELIQSEGGVYSIDKDYIIKLRKICDENNLLLCFDEVQTGFGRIGKLFHYENIGVKPDILTSAKAMGNGFPVAACLIKQKIADAILPGTHGSTYAGNPLAVTVVDAVLDIITADGFLENVQENAKYFWQKLLNLQNEFPHFIKNIRGEGFLVGIEFSSETDTKKFLLKCLDLGLAMTKTSNPSIVRILPPLIIEKPDIDIAMNITHQVLKKF